MSSRSYSAQVEMTGVFSNDPEKSPMSQATKVCPTPHIVRPEVTNWRAWKRAHLAACDLRRLSDSTFIRVLSVDVQILFVFGSTRIRFSKLSKAFLCPPHSAPIYYPPPIVEYLAARGPSLSLSLSSMSSPIAFLYYYYYYFKRRAPFVTGFRQVLFERRVLWGRHEATPGRTR